MRKVYLLTWVFIALFFKANAQPVTAAPVPPARVSTDVLSLYSGAYTDLAGTNWNPSWGQSTVVSEITIAGNATRSYTNLNYQGIEFASPIDVSNMDSLHIDIWTPNCTAFDVFLINTTPVTVEQLVTLTPTLSGWNSFNIALSQYSNIALHNVLQIKLVGTPFGSSTVYADNIYFYKKITTPLITNFSVASKTMGSAPFTITAPTSTSTGAFTYSSSNTSVATISGNTVTVVGVGYTYIKATQAAAGAFGVGTKSTTFTVISALPTTPTVAAPIPPVRSASNVISLFSGAYADLSGTNFNPNWGQSGFTSYSEITIGADVIKKYGNFNYQGWEFGAPVNASTFSNLHLDIWTPDCTSFEVYPIVAGQPEQKFTFTPTIGGWKSVDIPLSTYTIPLTSIIQFKFVSAAPALSNVFLDNVYFWKNPVTPVTLLNFKAAKAGASSLISWKTATETNNKGFAVERSANGKDWTEITFVNGSNNSTTLKEYTATDASPIKGINYYRLKQIDNDGKQTYSATVVVNFTDKQELAFSFYPNPAKNTVTILLNTIETANASLNMLTADGRIVKSYTLSTNNSNNSFLINVANVAKGFYYLVLTDGTTIKSSKIVID